jgi:hypothetical protein
VQGELFEVEPVALPPPAKKLSADRRRTQRQAEAIESGVHPLSLATRSHIPLHPDAPPRRGEPGKTCGDCKMRQKLSYHRRSYAKCVLGYQATDAGQPSPPPRVSHGAGTDVRAWWPACKDFEWGDPLSDDAARWVPPTKE